MSRLYGGIHYRFDLVEGNKVGRRIGDLVIDRMRMKRKMSDAKKDKSTLTNLANEPKTN
jgi:hypothetical protein